MSLLLVEDKSALREVLARGLREAGHEVAEAASAEEALALLAAGRVELLISDLRLPGMDGLELLRRAREQDAEIDALMMSAQAGVQDAVRALQLGAQDFLVKPFPVEELTVKAAKALAQRRLRSHSRLMAEELSDRRGTLLGNSPAMKQVQELIRKLATARSNVLILGESGTGKELAARAIHDGGAEPSAPFVAVHCAALAPGLLESELFGHEKGAFTGADSRHVGRFEAAESGTLFLDEVSEIPMETQVKLLRVLQERTFERVGGGRSLPLRARVIAASNRDLEAAMRKGLFREDLYYRLAVVSLRLPPLRDRREDIPELVHAFFERYRRETARPLQGLAPGLVEALRNRPWPGNVRELQNAVERAVVLSDGPLLELPAGESAAQAAESPGGPLQQSLDALELKLIQEALAASGGNQAQAARHLGLSRSALQYKLQKHGI